MDAPAAAAARRVAALLGHLSFLAPASATGAALRDHLSGGGPADRRAGGGGPADRRAGGGGGVAPQACAATASGGGGAPPLRLRFSDEVAAALAAGGPVVALESTIVAHGMPFPRNLETALAVEAAVRAAGATPATIAVLGGACCIGLSAAQLEALARAGPTVRKVSRRDLPAVIACGGDGATTVAGTMILAAAAGIDVFCTGGIGGVHRGGESTLDVSADLTELGRTPVAVVCAGAKSILDLPRTLEVLETQARAGLWARCFQHRPARTAWCLQCARRDQNLPPELNPTNPTPHRRASALLHTAQMSSLPSMCAKAA